MTRLTRRSLITAAVAVPAFAWLESCASLWCSKPPRKTLTRYDARSPKGQAMLKTYAAAVGKMQATAEDDPRGWLFQWYTHSVKDSTDKAAEVARVFPVPGPARDLADAAWETCQAHHGEDENNFLPWHRAYVYYFEAIIRKVSGDDSFTLPYWDYSSADPAVRGVIPPEFTSDGDPVFGPLFRGDRNTGVNSGDPIHQGQPGDPLSTSSLGQCTYSPQSAEAGFDQTLDFGLHGNVHVLVGGPQNMGSVPWAARDPIFWLHHCNIDRLWASWSAAGRASPALPATFAFTDGDGNRVDAVLKNFVDIAALRYTYDRLDAVPGCPSSPQALAETAKAQQVAAMVKTTPVQLDVKPVQVTLEPVAAQGEGEPMSVGVRVKNLKPGRRLYLIVKDLRAAAEPGVLYHLHLQLPEKPTDEQSKARYVGSINFFGASHHGNHADAPQKGPERFVSFDVTDLAKSLQAKGDLPDKPTITIIPAGKPAEAAKPVIGEMKLVEQ